MHFYFQPIRLLDPDCCYKFTYLMANSADPVQKPTDLALYCLQRQGIPSSAGKGLTRFPQSILTDGFEANTIDPDQARCLPHSHCWMSGKHFRP